MTDRVGDLRILMSGIAIVEGNESLVVADGNGTSLALRWVRDDDNVLTGGTIDALTADLPKAGPEIDVVHVFAIASDGGERRVEARFFVEWIHGWSKRVSYTVLASFDE